MRHVRKAVPKDPLYPFALLIPKSPWSSTAPKPGRNHHQVCHRGQGHSQHHVAKCNPAQRGAMGKRRKEMVTHEETRREEEGNISLRSCREVLPNKGKSQGAACLLLKSLPRCATWSQSTATPVQGCITSPLAPHPARGAQAALKQGEGHQTSWGPPACRSEVGHSTLPATSSLSSQEERQLLATHQHILHCLKYCVPTACPVQYETNLPEEMNRILLLKVLCPGTLTILPYMLCSSSESA